MKIVIFAGGVGTRMWPLSRVNSPKQFDQIFGGTPPHQLNKNKSKNSDFNKNKTQLNKKSCNQVSWCGGKSTLQLAYDRVAPTFGRENIYIQSIRMYLDIIKKQLPKMDSKRIFFEPARRDVGPAVFYATNKLIKSGYKGPIAIVWADHLMDRVDEFARALKTGEKLIKSNGKRFIFIGERPRFANNNLGWIKVGKKKGEIEKNDYFEFKGWKYKPEKSLCDRIYKSGEYFWNPGYFVTSVNFLIECYKKLAPEIYSSILKNKYENCPKISFDNAIIEKVNLGGAVVLKANMGWSDPGTLYALKEALEESSDSNVEKGNIVSFETRDSLVYNFEKGKIVTTVGLEGVVVVNTKDALIVVHKDNVVRISSLVKEMKNRKLDRYL